MMRKALVSSSRFSKFHRPKVNFCESSQIHWRCVIGIFKNANVLIWIQIIIHIYDPYDLVHYRSKLANPIPFRHNDWIRVLRESDITSSFLSIFAFPSRCTCDGEKCGVALKSSSIDSFLGTRDGDATYCIKIHYSENNLDRPTHFRAKLQVFEYPTLYIAIKP